MMIPPPIPTNEPITAESRPIKIRKIKVNTIDFAS